MHSLFITSDEVYFECKNVVHNFCEPSLSLPEYVLKRTYKYYGFESFDMVLSPEYWSVFQSLCTEHGESEFILAVLDPDPVSYFKNEFGYYNWAVISIGGSNEDYGKTISEHPANSIADSLLANSEKVVWLSISGNWIIWGQRSLEICVIASNSSEVGQYCHEIEWAMNAGLPFGYFNKDVPPEFKSSFTRNYTIKM